MKFYRLDEIPNRPDNVVFQESGLRGAIFFCLFALLTGGALAFGIAGTLRNDVASLPMVIAYVVAAALFLITWIALGSLRASLRPTNWLLRYNPDGLFIKFRSYLNSHFPQEDVAAFFLPNSEIAWARKTHEVRLIPDKGDGETTEGWTYLDLKLCTSDTADLESHLKRERMQEAPKVGISRTKYQHYPVRLLPEGILRLDWNGPSSRIVPRIDEALKVLRFSLPIEHEVFLKPKREELTDNMEMETRILEFAERGNIIDAVALTKRLYGYDTTEAKEFVETLLKRQRSRSSSPSLSASP